MIRNIIGFSGFSESGKTTLIEKIILELKKTGKRIAVIKHDGHDFDIDHEGRDSKRFADAGAGTVMVSSEYRFFHFEQKGKSLDEMISGVKDADLILLEGFKYAEVPQIGVTSARTGFQMPKDPEQYLAVATDEPGRSEYSGGTVFDLSDAEGICSFLCDALKAGKLKTEVKSPLSVGVAILTGGHSTRMGRPKESVVLPGDGRTMLDRICDEMSFFDERYLSIKKGQKIIRSDYTHVTDLFPDKGPIGGILSLLSFCKTDACLVLACDMAGFKKENALKILDAYQGEDLLFVKSPGGLEPLASVYSKKLIPALLKKIEENDLRLRSLCNLDVRIGMLEDENGLAYRNINSPKELMLEQGV